MALIAIELKINILYPLYMPMLPLGDLSVVVRAPENWPPHRLSGYNYLLDITECPTKLTLYTLCRSHLALIQCKIKINFVTELLTDMIQSASFVRLPVRSTVQ